MSDTGIPAEPTASQPGWRQSWKKQRWAPLSTLGESRQVRTKIQWLACKSPLLCPETGSQDGWLQGEAGLATKYQMLSYCFWFDLYLGSLLDCYKSLTIFQGTDSLGSDRFCLFFNVSFQGQMAWSYLFWHFVNITSPEYFSYLKNYSETQSREWMPLRTKQVKRE